MGTSAKFPTPFDHEDIKDVMKYVFDKYPNRKVFAVGASMGANNLTNLLGFEGEKTIVTAACAI